MEAVREKHASNFEKVLDEVQRKHPELNARLSLVPKGDGRLGIGKKSWPTYYLSGFWLGDILLDNLTSDDEDPPYKFIWVNHPNGGVDLEDAHKQLCDAAKVICSKEELHWLNSDQSQWGRGTGTAGISWRLGQSRAEFLELLLTDDGRGLVDSMVGHFESMVKFGSVLDGIYKSANQPRK
jgi:hypothetical protein